MFLTGFLFVAILVYTFAPIKSFLVKILVAVGSGICCGLLAMFVQYVGLFLTGFKLGSLISIIILIIVGQFYQHHILWIPVGIICGLGIVFAVLTLKFQKALTIVGTSFLGGILMISCVDYFIEQHRLMMYMLRQVDVNMVRTDQLCWYSWIILGCWMFCALVGVLTQWKITSQGFNHKEGE